MIKSSSSKFKISLLVIIHFLSISTFADQCKPDSYVYGENEVVDQLMVCSLGKSFDLDLTPHGDYVKSTARALVDQGLSNKTTILYAKLSGLWSARRAGFVETGWKCEHNRTKLTSIIELTGLSLEVVERVDIPLHRNQHKLAIHRPCKTSDLPLWMCRQSKPMYRTTKTWVNRAFFNLTLVQNQHTKKPFIEQLSLMFTCPETFKQKITYSPSAMYILSKYMQQHSFEASAHQSAGKSLQQAKVKRSPLNDSPAGISSITHPVSYATTQDGKGPTSPPYHNSVNLIMSQISQMLRSSLTDCIQIIDMDLALMNDYSSFSQYKFKDIPTKAYEAETKQADLDEGLINECSNEQWLRQRIELANYMSALELQEEQQFQQLERQQYHPSGVGQGHFKRSQTMLKYPEDPNQLLNPHGHYHDRSDRMIEDI